MKNHGRSIALLVGMGLVLSASAAQAQIRVAKDAGRVQSTNSGWTNNETARTPAMTMSAGDIELYAGMTDANIVAHILTGDSLEIAMSRLALTRSSNQSVRTFAQMIIDHHTKNSTEFMAMQKDEDIGIQAPSSDPIAAHGRMALNQLRNLRGAAFDRAYMQHQVMHHDADAAALQRMADVARDDDLEEDIEEKLLPVLKHHLAQARTLATQVGVNHSAHHMTP